MIGGRAAKIEDWTFAASLVFLQREPNWKICTATVLSRWWLLTAAHCVDDIFYSPKYLQVKICELIICLFMPSLLLHTTTPSTYTYFIVVKNIRINVSSKFHVCSPSQVLYLLCSSGYHDCLHNLKKGAFYLLTERLTCSY